MTHIHTTAMCSAQTTVNNDTHVHAQSYAHHTHTHTHCAQDGRGWDMDTRVMQQHSPFYPPDQRVGARLLHFVQKLRTFRHKTGRLQSRWETGKTQTNQTGYGDSLLTHRATPPKSLTSTSPSKRGDVLTSLAIARAHPLRPLLLTVAS